MVPWEFLEGRGLSAQREARRPFISQCRQWLACISATLTMIMVGMVYGWTTTTLPILIPGTGGVPISLTRDQASWIVSLTILGSTFGSLVCAKFADYKGRKNTLILCNVIFMFGWLTTCLVVTAPMLYLARMVLGIGVGIAYEINPIYLSEVADINMRGILGALIPVNVFIGSLLTCILRLYLTYKLFMVALLMISVIFCSLAMYFPDTPYFLVAKGRKWHACKSITYYKGIVDPHEMKMELRALRAQARYEIHSQIRYEIHAQIRYALQAQNRSDLHAQSARELYRPSTSEIHRPSTSEIHRPSASGIPPEVISEIRPEAVSELHPEDIRDIHPEDANETQAEDASELHTESNVDSHESTDTDEIYIDLPKYTWRNKLRAMLQRSNRKALFIIFGLIMAQHLSGNFIILQYLQVFFTETTIGIEPNIVTTWVVAVGLLSVSVSTIIVDFVKRRKLLILSTLGSCFTLFILGTYLFLIQHNTNVSTAPALPVIDLIIYQVMFQIGLGVLPNILLCELFPSDLRGFVRTIIMIFDGIIGFIVPKLYQMITDNVGSYSIYLIFAISCCLVSLMVFTWMPETKGKTNDEIEELLDGRNLNTWDEDDTSYEIDILNI